MSDTPDTDQKAVPHIGFYSCATVPAEFARKLERERDEAREDAAHWKIEYEIVEARLCGVKHERDNGIVSEKEIIPKLRKLVERAIDDLGWFHETSAQRLQEEFDKIKEDAK
jgi:hypothetical protein